MQRYRMTAPFALLEYDPGPGDGREGLSIGRRTGVPGEWVRRISAEIVSYI
jgi:hypothetical protein